MAYTITVPHTADSMGIYLFKKTVNVTKKATFKINIFASTRYILYINGEYVAEGPCRGAYNVSYYDTIDTDLFNEGENEIEVHVMHLTDVRAFASAMKYPTPCLVMNARSEFDDINTDVTWKCFFDKNHKLFPPIDFTPPLDDIYTVPDLIELPVTYKNTYIPSDNFDFYEENNSIYGSFVPFYYAKRPIPMIYPGQEFDLIPVKYGEDYIDFDAGKYVTAKISLTLSPNTNAEIICGECYEKEDGKKGLRDDTSGVIKGKTDYVKTGDTEYTYNPFWYKSFRYIRVKCQNPKQSIKSFKARIVHYPLDITGSFECSNDYYNKMYDISINTLLCCMHEIFMDCPYYEQQQYIMDSAIEIACSLRLSGDTRLIEKCIDEFSASISPEGYLCANYPCSYTQIIPGFSFFWIYILKDYLDYSANVDFAKKYTGTIDKIFEGFENNLTSDGLITRTRFWDFADWVQDDKWIKGVPPVKRGEGLTLYSLYYACALKDASYILKKVGREKLAEEYDERYKKLKCIINTKLFDKEKELYIDGTGNEKTYCVHPIIWSILSGVADKEKTEAMIPKLFDESVPKASFSMNYYLFRALEKSGHYDLITEYLPGWESMIDKHCTTWCEAPYDKRSECHGWSSAPLYEFSSNILGVKYSFEDVITIKPTSLSLSYAKGNVPTRHGNVMVSWKIDGGSFTIDIASESDIPKKLILPNGEVYEFTDRCASFCCKL